MKDSVPYGILILHADFFTLPVFLLFMFSLSLSQQHPFSLTCNQRGNSKEPQPRFITDAPTSFRFVLEANTTITPHC